MESSISGLVELSNRPMVEWWMCRIVEWWKGEVVESNRRIVEWWSGRIVEWWNGGILAEKLKYCVISYVHPVMAAIFNLLVTATSECSHLSCRVAGSSIEAEILRYFICISSNGGHL